jgi:hypothetical protein
MGKGENHRSPYSPNQHTHGRNQKMIVSLFTITNNNPALTLHNEQVKIDFGTILIELDKLGFKNLIASLLFQAANQGIDLST